MHVKNTELPLFPLGITLLEGEILPLRIFEPRYIQLINDVIDNNNSFGIPYVKNSIMQDYGSEVKVVEILKRRSNGEMVITIEGCSNFKIVDFKKKFHNRMYSGGTIKKIAEKDSIANFEIVNLVSELHLDKRIGGIQKISLSKIASSLKLNDEEKFNFISLQGTDMQEKYLLKRLAYYKLIKNQEDKLQKNFTLN